MRFQLLCVSKRPRDWVKQASDEYARRLKRGIDFNLIEIAPAADPNNAKAIEAQRLREATPKGFQRIAMDERGELWSSVELARRLERWRDNAVDLVCYIGGADGLDRALIDAADYRWSLSPLTLPHQLARVVLIEQLYRAQAILENHPYHRP